MSKAPASFAQVCLFAVACVALAVAGIAIRWLPFRLLVRTMDFGGKAGATSGSPGHGAEQIVLAVRRASARVPWRTVCFHEGLALQWLLRFRGFPSILHYGLRPGEGQLSAHVWISLGGRILIGEAEAAAHACVAIFPAASA